MKRLLCCMAAVLLAACLLMPSACAEEERFLLSFVGDCTFGTEYRGFNQTVSFPAVVGDDYDYPFANVVSYFQNDDFTMANLEGVLLDDGVATKKGFAFRGSTGYAGILSRGSVEAVTVANNHFKDFGDEGCRSTLEALEDAGVPCVQFDSGITCTTERGLKLGIYGCCLTMGVQDFRQGLTLEKLESTMEEMRNDGAEIVILAVHWGDEGSSKPISGQKALAHRLIDLGVDIIYGSHSHVLQPVEAYNDGIIYYSLGNFSFGGNHWPSDMDTAIIQQEIIRDENGTRLGEVTAIPACVSSSGTGQNNFQPTPYPEDSPGYRRTMAKLFPENW